MRDISLREVTLTEMMRVLKQIEDTVDNGLATNFMPSDIAQDMRERAEYLVKLSEIVEENPTPLP